jgi:TolA-binding protein
MNPKVRLLFYVVLLVCMASFALGYLKAYRSTDDRPSSGVAGTNAAAGAAMTNATNNPADTNLVSTNAAGVAQTNGPNTPAPAVVDAAPAEELTARRSSPRLSRLMAYGVAMFFTVVGLGILLGHDISKFFANRVENFIFNDNLEGVKDPQYDEAEKVWGSGKYLEAVRLMRDYLKKHPREQYVALRIAEIYEKDLQNYLASALEYEEVLKKRLPPERWGWAAIHLANLYSGKLNKVEEATRLLHRIVEEYGQTAAAKKARERLGIPEPVVVVAQAVGPVPPAELEPEEPPEPAPVPQPPASNLPPGFRPKS